MDFHARQYDPQIGRFLGIDPLADAYGQQIFSTYSAMGNAPTHMIDPNGESFYDNNTLIAAGKYSNSLPTDDEILSEMLMDQRRVEGYNYGGGGGGFGNLGTYRSTLDFVNGFGAGAYNSFWNNILEIFFTNKNVSWSDIEHFSFSNGDLEKDKWVKVTLKNGIKYEYQMISEVIKGGSGKGGRGIRLALKISAPKGYSDVDFIQTVDYSDDYEGEFLDGANSNGSLPYYWSENQRKGNTIFSSIHQYARDDGYTHYFDDTPGSNSYLATGYLWRATLSLVGKHNGTYKPIITFEWGYLYYYGSATPIMPYPRIISNYSKFHQEMIDKLNKR